MAAKDAGKREMLTPEQRQDVIDSKGAEKAVGASHFGV